MIILEISFRDESVETCQLPETRWNHRRRTERHRKLKLAQAAAGTAERMQKVATSTTEDFD